VAEGLGFCVECWSEFLFVKFAEAGFDVVAAFAKHLEYLLLGSGGDGGIG
jgi:hypothetical protein